MSWCPNETWNIKLLEKFEICAEKAARLVPCIGHVFDIDVVFNSSKTMWQLGCIAVLYEKYSDELSDVKLKA